MFLKVFTFFHILFNESTQLMAMALFLGQSYKDLSIFIEYYLNENSDSQLSIDKTSLVKVTAKTKQSSPFITKKNLHSS